MADSQGAIEQIDDLDLDDERVTASPSRSTTAPRSRTAAGTTTRPPDGRHRSTPSTSGRRDGPPPDDERKERLPLTEHGAAIYYFYHERVKGDEDRERPPNEEPRAFVREACEWWHNGDAATAAGNRPLSTASTVDERRTPSKPVVSRPGHR
jgi:hypothetical protein